VLRPHARCVVDVADAADLMAHDVAPTHQNTDFLPVEYVDCVHWCIEVGEDAVVVVVVDPGETSAAAAGD